MTTFLAFTWYSCSKLTVAFSECVVSKSLLIIVPVLAFFLSRPVEFQATMAQVTAKDGLRRRVQLPCEQSYNVNINERQKLDGEQTITLRFVTPKAKRVASRPAKGRPSAAHCHVAFPTYSGFDSQSKSEPQKLSLPFVTIDFPVPTTQRAKENKATTVLDDDR